MSEAATDTTEDAFLGGQLRLRQPKSGHRAGHDAMLLAAATPARSGDRVVDLGAAPGGWSQIAAKRVGAADGKGQVIAIDLLEMPEIAGVSFAQLDFLKQDAPDRLRAMMGGAADVVLSDMAANTTGHRKTDQLRILGLVESAAAFACEMLNPGGTFLAKAFQSGADADLLAQLKRDFASVRHVKPAASRQDSSERYVLATGFRGGPKTPA